MKEININGEIYIKKSDIENQIVNDDYFIVRTYSAGVFFGNIEKEEGREVTMINVQCIHYWEGAASLLQMAVEGVKNPEECRITCIAPKIKVKEAIEILSCTKEAVQNLKGVPLWIMK